MNNRAIRSESESSIPIANRGGVPNYPEQEEKEPQYESEWFGSEWDEWYRERTPYKQYLEEELLGKPQ